MRKGGQSVLGIRHIDLFSLSGVVILLMFCHSEHDFSPKFDEVLAATVCLFWYFSFVGQSMLLSPKALWCNRLGAFPSNSLC